MIVRHACKKDCAAIGEIYNHAVLHTAAIWNDKTVDTDNRIAWFEARTLAGYPVLVAEENGAVPGTPLSATGAPSTAFVTRLSIRCTSIWSIRVKALAAR